MVGRECTVAGRERRAARVGELVGMQLYRQAERLCLLQHSRGLSNVKSNALAEHVHRVDQLLLERRGKHLLAHEFDIVVGTPLVFLGNCVGAEESSLDRDGLAEPARDPQHLQLGVPVEAIARFDLDDGRAFIDPLRESSFCNKK